MEREAERLDRAMGRVAHYRPLYEGRMKTSVVVGHRMLERLDGASLTLLVLENGDEIPLEEAYLDVATASAS